MTELQEKAQQYLNCFEQEEFGEGDTKIKKWIVKDNSDPQVTEMVYSAHEDMMPDDWKYSFVVESLQALAEHENPEDAEADMEPDIYTYGLLAWLSSNITRLEYLTQALNEFDLKDGFAAISQAQEIEKCDVLYSVRNFLEEFLVD